MDLKITGKVEILLPVQQGVSQSGKEWMKQDVVLLTDGGQYPRHIAATIMGKERIDKFALQVGETITCHLDIDAREFKDRWFNSINIWKVDRDGQASTPVQQGVTHQQPVQPQTPPQGDSDDLPF